MPSLNKARIRKQIIRAIDKLPAEIELKRIVKVGPSYDYEEKPVTIAVFNAFLNRSSSAPKSDKTLLTEASNIQVIGNIGLLLVWEEGFEVRKDDYFILDGIKHEVVYPKNNYDIYWECDVRVVTDIKNEPEEVVNG